MQRLEALSRHLPAQGLAGKIPVAGQDAELTGVQRIVQGTQIMTVYKPIKLLTEKAAEIGGQNGKRGEDRSKQKNK